MRLLVFLLATFTTICAAGQTLISAPPTVPQASAVTQTQYLLKADYNVLEGNIHQEGRYYIVQVANGGLMYVPQDQTLAICKSMEEVYSARVAAIPSEDVVSYLGLTDWCIKYKMLDHAQRHLDNAKRIQGDYPYIPVMERRLTVAKQQLKQSEVNNAPAQGVNYNDPVVQINRLRNEKNALEQIAKNMPGDTLKQYLNEIQPVLLNSCGLTNCHSTASNNSFQLTRTPQSRYISLKNLHAVLRQVDRRNPGDSQLLIMASECHGGMKTPVFSRTQASIYNRLESWVARIVRPSQSQPLERSSQYESQFGDVSPNTPVTENNMFGDAGFDSENANFDSESIDLPSARRTSSPNVKRGNPDPMFYAEEVEQTPPNASMGTVRQAPQQAPGEQNPEYTDEFDYNQYGNSTVKTVRINGEQYASPTGLPGPAAMPTPAAQKLNQMKINEKLYGNPDGPEVPKPTAAAGVPQPVSDNSSLTEAERRFYGAKAPVAPAVGNSPQVETTIPSPVKSTPAVPPPTQTQEYDSAVPNPAPTGSFEPGSFGTNQKPTTTDAAPAPQPTRKAAPPAVQPQRKRPEPPPQNDDSDGYDAFPRLDKLFGN